MNNNTQNEKIAGITEKTLIVGIDVGSEKHFARAFDWRGFEFTKKAFVFFNSEQGFKAFDEWVAKLMAENGKTDVIPGMEPTGHYWFNLGSHLHDQGIKTALVNPHHVKKSKELDDNNPTKNDRKDPKVIAGLVKDGRFSYPYIPEGVYAELRNYTALRLRCQKEMTTVKNQLARWFSIYFPEYTGVYKRLDAISGLMVLKEAPLPENVLALGVEGITQIWRKAKLHGVGIKTANKIYEAAEHSIGIRTGNSSACMEIHNLLEDYDRLNRRLTQIVEALHELVTKIPNTEKLLAIKGVGINTVSGFMAEVGDIGRFNNPKQLQKLAGYALVENSSGKHKGETTISKRGRKRLRYMLFEVALSLVAKNTEFRSIHKYYTTRKENPLKKMQSLIAVACKLIRVFYVVLTRGVDYDPIRFMGDIKRPAMQGA